MAEKRDTLTMGDDSMMDRSCLAHTHGGGDKMRFAVADSEVAVARASIPLWIALDRSRARQK